MYGCAFGTKHCLPSVSEISWTTKGSNFRMSMRTTLLWLISSLFKFNFRMLVNLSSNLNLHRFWTRTSKIFQVNDLFALREWIISKVLKMRNGDHKTKTRLLSSLKNSLLNNYESRQKISTRIKRCFFFKSLK